MSFDSYHFIGFVLLVVVLYHAIRPTYYRYIWILLCSYFFYGFWEYRFLFLLFGMTVVSFYTALWLENNRGCKNSNKILAGFILLALMPLVLFKYINFFGSTTVGFFGLFDVELDWVVLDIILPIGISFFTLQAISYVVDVHARRMPAETEFHRYALYISFFPQLVAGPIVRAIDFLPQLHTGGCTPTTKEFSWHLLRFCWGLFKKVFIADRLAMTIVDPVFAQPDAASALVLLLAVIAFGLMIYTDFSAYSDMALAVAGMLGFRLRENFRSPYTALSIREFWRRWHISLSTWIRDYLYIPLGGSKTTTRARAFSNLLIVMFLCGLWHGAAWTFVIWGVYHGVLLAVGRAFSLRRLIGVVRIPLSWISTTMLVMFGWLIFRSESIEYLGLAMTRILEWSDGTFRLEVPFLIFLGFCWLVVMSEQAVLRFLENEQAIYCRALRLPSVAVVSVCAVLAALMLMLNDPSAGQRAFIYFQF
jgi:alginate O-acetyltransferase complex protein AlgI